MKFNNGLISAMVLASTSISTSALAFTDNAKVLSTETVMQTYTQRVPQEVCWSEEVPIYNEVANDSHTNEIVGGILGGVIGNQFGSGRGNKAMTAAGALLGASIAHDDEQKKSQTIVGYRQVERCRTEYQRQEKQRVDYYLVTAIYNNQEFSFKTNTKPGDVVKVNISPVYK